MKPTQTVLNELVCDYIRVLSEPVADGKWQWVVQQFCKHFEMMTGQSVYDLDDCKWWLDEWDGLHDDY